MWLWERRQQCMEDWPLRFMDNQPTVSRRAAESDATWTLYNKRSTLNNEPTALSRDIEQWVCSLSMSCLEQQYMDGHLAPGTLLLCCWESEDRAGSIILRGTLSCLSNVSKRPFDYTAELAGFFITRNTTHHDVLWKVCVQCNATCTEI